MIYSLTQFTLQSRNLDLSTYLFVSLFTFRFENIPICENKIGGWLKRVVLNIFYTLSLNLSIIPPESWTTSIVKKMY